MSHKDYLPPREVDLLGWSRNLASKLLASPEDYGISPQQATEYDVVQLAYANAYTVANDPSSRIKANIKVKNQKKEALIAATRPLVAFLQAWPGMTNEKRLALEIPIRDRGSTPIGRPTVAPATRVETVMGQTVTLCIFDPTSSRKRAKVKGAIGAWVYSFVGEDYPTDPLLWEFQGTASKYTYEVKFHNAPSGSRVWLCAAWVTLKGEAGPVSMPIATYVVGGGVGSKAGLKMAA